MNDDECMTASIIYKMTEAQTKSSHKDSEDGTDNHQSCHRIETP
jgi:hypothetical protein